MIGGLRLKSAQCSSQLHTIESSPSYLTSVSLEDGLVNQDSIGCLAWPKLGFHPSPCVLFLWLRQPGQQRQQQH